MYIYCSQDSPEVEFVFSLYVAHRTAEIGGFTENLLNTSKRTSRLKQHDIVLKQNASLVHLLSLTCFH